MKSASAGLIALLAAGTPHFQADLVTITLADSTALLWTTWDDTLTVDAVDYAAGVGALSRSKSRCAAGLEVSSMTMEIGINLTTDVLGIGASLAAQNGAFDGARIKVDRVFMAVAGTSIGTITMFEGAVAGVDIASTKIRLTTKSDLEKLNIKLPRNLYSPSCSAILYDAVCGLDRGDFGEFGIIAGTPTDTVFTSDISQPNGTYTSAIVAFTSGVNSGSRRQISLFTSDTFTASIPFPSVPEVGDTFTVYLTCDKTAETCAGTFNNLIRFRGFPYVPKPEDAR